MALSISSAEYGTPGVSSSAPCFANNQIPQNRIDPVARKIAPYYPAPNRPPTVNPWGPSSNYLWNPVNSYDLDAIDWRLDHSNTDNSKLFLRESFNYQRGRLPLLFTERAPDARQ